MLTIKLNTGVEIKTNANHITGNQLLFKKEGQKDLFVALVPESAVVIRTDFIVPDKAPGILDAIKIIEAHKQMPASMIKSLQNILKQKTTS